MKVTTKNNVFHSADSRGLANHGWLISRHTFSFASYYNPDRTNFGALRVLNDDIVKPGQGFGTHPHDNMEIISIPLSGSLAHKDSTGRAQEIKTGEVQIMSAGTGLYHSEYNYSKTDEVNFLQIWVLPKEKNIAPRYDQKDFTEQFKNNQLVTVVSPNDTNALWINQDAIFSLGQLNAKTKLTYKQQFKGNGVYIFSIDGSMKVNGQQLQKRDAFGTFESNPLSIEILEDSHLLLIEVPNIY